MRGTKPQLVVANDAVSGRLNPPAFLSKEAKAEWRRVLPDLIRRRILTTPDLGSLENYCIAQGRVRQIEVLLVTGFDAALVRAQDKAIATARQLAAELGMTPVSRSRPSMREEGDDDDLAGLDL